MPRTFTLAQLRDRTRELTDLENVRAQTDTEINKRLSSAYAKYYAKLVKAGIGYPAETVQTISAVAGTSGYSLPADHFATLRVDYQAATNYVIPLEEIDIRETDKYQWSGSYAFVYRLAGGKIILLPTPGSAGTYLHTYAPAPDDLTTDGQTVDGVAGWEDAIILDAAIRCCIKAEADCTTLLRERDIVDARIDEEAEMKSLTHGRKIVRRRDERREYDPSDWPPWVR